jgi:hypothetical protein
VASVAPPLIQLDIQRLHCAGDHHITHGVFHDAQTILEKNNAH